MRGFRFTHLIYFLPLIIVSGWFALAIRIPAPVVANEPAAVTQEPETYVLDAMTIAEKVNEYRVSKGLSALAISEQLNAAACAKADDMIANKYWGHVSPSGVQPWYWFNQVGYTGYQTIGENLAYGFPTEVGVVDGWIKSPTHEANMVGPYAEMGMCIRNGDLLGTGTYNVIVNHFGLR